MELIQDKKKNKGKKMADKSLSKLSRSELLDILYKQAKQLEELEAENATLKKELQTRNIRLSKVGSIAEASFVLSNIFQEAQKVADTYVSSVKKIVDSGQIDRYDYPNTRPQQQKVQQVVNQQPRPQQQYVQPQPPRQQQMMMQQQQMMQQQMMQQQRTIEQPKYVSKRSNGMSRQRRNMNKY